MKVLGFRPRTFTNLPSASGNLIANFPLVMLLLIRNQECNETISLRSRRLVRAGEERASLNKRLLKCL